jgi:uroporphyrinogen-III decarboxylase
MDGGEIAMPKPADFDKLTPSEKLEARLQAWQNPEGVQFATKEAEQAYKKRVQMLIDVIKLKKPARVPVSISTGFYPFAYAGYSCKDPMYDYKKLGAAMTKFHADFLPDVMASSALYGPGKAFEILDYKLYRWPGHGVPENTSYQCAEAEFMKPTEYVDFLRDPTDYFLRFYLPRIFGALDSWKTLPPFTDILELPFTGPAMIHFGMPHIQESLKKLQEAGKISFDWLMKCIEIDNSIKSSLGLPSFMGAFSKAPFDTLGDTMRGTRAILLDKFRKQKEILEAVERITPLMIDMGIRNVQWGAPPTVFFPLHKGADSFMSPADFKKFYWPSFKAAILGLIKEGLIPYSFVEGSYNQRLDIITDPDIPAGTTIWFFDRTDMKEVKKHLGGWGCFAGNVPSSLLKTATPQEVKDHTKRLLDDVAGDGGYFVSNGAVLDEAKPENLHALIDTTKEYKL